MKRKVWQLLFLSGIIFTYVSLEAADSKIGQRFLQQTGLGLFAVAGTIFKSGTAPPPYKEYPDTPKIKLPPPDYKSGITVEEAISHRRSIRNYVDKPLTIAELSQLLYAAQGVTGKIQGTLLRSAPSAGALYPLEIYPVVHNVSGVKPGIYHYNVRNHELEQLKTGDHRKQIKEACLGQKAVETAQVIIVISSIFERICYKYGERGYRYSFMEAGHVGQNIYLQATSLGLGAVAMGAFYDDKLNKLLNIDGDKEAAIYVLSVGKK